MLTSADDRKPIISLPCRFALYSHTRPLSTVTTPEDAPPPHIPVLLEEICTLFFQCLYGVPTQTTYSEEPTPQNSGRSAQRQQAKELREQAYQRLLAGRETDLLYFDGTLGAGGHAAALLGTIEGMKLLGVDQDPTAISMASQTLAPFIADGRAELVQSRFSALDTVLAGRSRRPDFFLFDLGVSSMQLDTTERGFSFEGGPLDMRMSQSGRTVLDLIQESSAEQLAHLIRTLGDEKLANPIGKGIKRQHELGRLHDTKDIRGICRSVYRYTNEKLGSPPLHLTAFPPVSSART